MSYDITIICDICGAKWHRPMIKKPVTGPTEAPAVYSIPVVHFRQVIVVDHTNTCSLQSISLDVCPECYNKLGIPQ